MNHLPNSYGIPKLTFDLEILTPRELEILQRALLQQKNIAYDLGISYNTVVSHITNIRNKTGLLTSNELCYFLGTKNGHIIN
jgi:DNA-binding CsgD family transcriptional regulator